MASVTVSVIVAVIEELLVMDVLIVYCYTFARKGAFGDSKNGAASVLDTLPARNINSVPGRSQSSQNTWARMPGEQVILGDGITRLERELRHIESNGWSMSTSLNDAVICGGKK